MYDRVLVKEKARQRLREFRGTCIGVYVLYSALAFVVGGATWGLAVLFLSPPLMVGYSFFNIGVWRGETPPFETLFCGFRRYTQSLVAVLWMYLWVFIWSLLLFIPGIVKFLAYSMTPYLVSQYPDIDPKRALKVSMAITNGRKAEIFVMYLSFLGWALLSSLTLGILAVLFVAPYQQIALAGMYETMVADALERGVIYDEDLRR